MWTKFAVELQSSTLNLIKYILDLYSDIFTKTGFIG